MGQKKAKYHIVGASSGDWLTLTTFDEGEASEVATTLFERPGGWESGKIQQYDGARGEGWFWGVGEQNGRRHWRMQVSGAVADAMTRRWRMMGLRKCRATRLDLQVTLPEWEGRPSLAVIRDALREENAKWKRRGRKPTVDMVDKQNKPSTLYVGSRETKNGVTLRVYEKPIRKEMHLRFETEFRGSRAFELWQRIAEDEKQMSKALAGEFDILPDVAQEAWRPFRGAMERQGDRVRVEAEESDCWRRLNWLRDTIAPCLLELIGTEVEELAAKEIAKLNSAFIRGVMVRKRGEREG